MRLYQTVPDCEESEAEHLSPVHWCCVAYEAVPGRWVPWCVEHDERGWTSSCATGISKNRTGNTTTNEHDPCRWHPQGAFIPEVEEADDA